MAGDNKTSDQREIVPAPDYSDPFPGILQTLEDIRDTLRGRVEAGPGIFDIPAAGSANPFSFGTHMWQRLQVQAIVVSASAAGTFILNIGSYSRIWNLDLGVVVIPFAYTLDRALDVTFAGTAVGMTPYLIASGE